MIVKTKVKPGTYYDSVTLMKISREIASREGIAEAIMIMGTDSNKEILKEAGLDPRSLPEEGGQEIEAGTRDEIEADDSVAHGTDCDGSAGVDGAGTEVEDAARGEDSGVDGAGTEVEDAARGEDSGAEIADAGANDLIMVVKGEVGCCQEALAEAEELLSRRQTSTGEVESWPRSLEGALDYLPEANLVIISVPGKFAAREARRALNEGLHVMLFSDNVELKDEIELKELAREKNLLMMGPDCGTAIINQKPLAFANVVEAGPVGIVAASGTGAQEVSCLVQRQGVGLSQVIGIGGRDLSLEVGGMEMIKDMKALGRDQQTGVIVLISKPPAEEVGDRIIRAAGEIGKPVVINFLGWQGEIPDEGNIYQADTLEDAAWQAVRLVGSASGGTNEGPVVEEKGLEAEKEGLEVVEERLEAEKEVLKAEDDGLEEHQEQQNKQDKGEQQGQQEQQEQVEGRRYLRGLFVGGTLAAEALMIMEQRGFSVFSNITKKEKFKLQEGEASRANTILDLGEDEFTRGRPHPMIDPGLRRERLMKEIGEIEDREVAVILVDVVLGYGSHPDPGGELARAVLEARGKIREQDNAGEKVRGGNAAGTGAGGTDDKKRKLEVIASVTGTAGDPQNLEEQVASLKEAGIVVADSNAEAARIAADLLAGKGLI